MKALLSNSPAGRGQLVKIIITLEPHGIFGSNLPCLYKFTHCPATGMQNGDEASPSIDSTGRGRLENAHSSLTAWYVLVKFCILMHFLKPCRDTGMQNGDKASQRISPADHGQLVKMLITLGHMVYFDQILFNYTF